MRPFDVSGAGALPEFAAEQATTGGSEAELAELLAELSLVSASDVSPSDVSQGRARLLGTVNQSGERFAPFFGALSKFFDLSVEALRDIFARSADESAWQPGPLPWVSLFHFAGGPALAGLDTGFVRLKKGMPFPAHRHLGNERVLILAGSYRDHEQRLYGPGDHHDMARGSEHSLQMSADEDVLLAVITGEIQVLSAP